MRRDWYSASSAGFGSKQDLALEGVENDPSCVHRRVAHPVGANDDRDTEGPGDDGGMRGRAARFEDEPEDLVERKLDCR